MSISLSSDTQRLIEERMKQGGYRTADDLVHAAIDALDETEVPQLDEEILDAIDRAEAQIERGEVMEINDVRQEFRARFKSK
jgi:putative addiction module CopG family antidote